MVTSRSAVRWCSRLFVHLSGPLSRGLQHATLAAASAHAMRCHLQTFEFANIIESWLLASPRLASDAPASMHICDIPATTVTTCMRPAMHASFGHACNERGEPPVTWIARAIHPKQQGERAAVLRGLHKMHAADCPQMPSMGGHPRPGEQSAANGDLCGHCRRGALAYPLRSHDDKRSRDASAASTIDDVCMLAHSIMTNFSLQ